MDILAMRARASSVVVHDAALALAENETDAREYLTRQLTSDGFDVCAVGERPGGVRARGARGAGPRARRVGASGQLWAGGVPAAARGRAGPLVEPAGAVDHARRRLCSMRSTGPCARARVRRLRSAAVRLRGAAGTDPRRPAPGAVLRSRTPRGREAGRRPPYALRQRRGRGGRRSRAASTSCS